MLRVVSYNIHGGRDSLWRKRLVEAAESLRELDADVIAVQEVHQNRRFGYQADFLAERLNAHCAYAPTVSVAGGVYGVAIFSRHPIESTCIYRLPAKREPRVLLKTRMQWRGTLLEVWATHLSLHRGSRDAQMAALARHALAARHPLILLGDFNTTAPSLPSHFRDCGREMGFRAIPTLIAFPKRVDYIFVSPEWSICDYRVIDVRWSDHYPIAVTLQLPKPPVPPE